MHALAKTAALAILILLPASVTSAQEMLWARQTGGTAGEEASGIARDAFDNLYTYGRFSGTVDFDPGPGVFSMTATGSFDMYLTKLDRDGKFVWAKRFGGTNRTSSGVRTCVAIDGSSLYLTGDFLGTTDFDPGPGTFNMTSDDIYNDLFVVKLDTAGNFIWARQVGQITGATGLGYGMTLLADPGGVYVGGRFVGNVDFDPGPGVVELVETSATLTDGFILRLNQAGSFVWADQFKGGGNDPVYRLAAGEAGNLYAVGRGEGGTDLDPGPGVSLINALGYIVKLTSAGSFIWGKPTNSANSEPWALSLDKASHILVAGGFQGTADFDPGPATFTMASTSGIDGFISEFDKDGNFVKAARVASGASTQNVFDIEHDAFGNLYASGMFSATTDFDPGAATVSLVAAGGTDAFVAKYDPAGLLLWVSGFGGTLNDAVYDLVRDSTGDNLCAIGTFNGTADFDPGPATLNLTSAGGSDVFVWKYGFCDVWMEAGPTTGIRFSPDGSPLSFDVVTGRFSMLRVDRNFSRATCLGVFGGNPATDATIPPVGDGIYYISRGRSICAAQGYGNSSLTPDPRDQLDLASPCP